MRWEGGMTDGGIEVTSEGDVHRRLPIYRSKWSTDEV